MQNKVKEILKQLKEIFPEIEKIQLDILSEEFDNIANINNILKKNPKKIIDYAIILQHFSLTETKELQILPKNKKQEEIVTVVFDIRSSTDLLKNTKLKDFSDFINNLIKTAKSILFSEEYLGIYDKFTGDGFIVHFSRKISGKDFIKKAILYSKKILVECERIFKEITDKLEIDFSDKMGISVGIDLGEIIWFKNGVELSVIGKSIIYASRLCDEAQKNQILVNNLVYKKIKTFFEFKEQKIKPKGFTEKFTVYRLIK